MRSGFFVVLVPLAAAVRIIQSNDDGWAENNLRTFFNVLDKSGHDLVLSAPAENQSGKGSLDATPSTVGSAGCEYSSCPPNSPATGSNSSDTRLNYVNSYPVTSIKTGITTTAPALWNGAAPELALTGPNVGANAGLTVQFSGTVGAAVYAAHTAGIPAIAFSGASGSPTAWNASTPLSSQVYADLALNVTSTIIASGTPYLPNDAWLNVNFGAMTSTTCTSASQFKYILTRINTGVLSAPDVDWCGSTRLPTETSVMSRSGCYVSISVGDGSDKTTIDATRQAAVLPKLKPILSCLT